MVLPPSTPSRSSGKPAFEVDPPPQADLDDLKISGDGSGSRSSRWRIPAILGLGLILFGVLGLLTSLYKVDSIEDHLQAEAVERLEENGIEGATVEIDGRDVSVTGVSAADGSRARAILDDEWGIRNVSIASTGTDADVAAPTTSEAPATTQSPAPNTTAPPAPETTVAAPTTTTPPTSTSSTTEAPSGPAIVDLSLTVEGGEIALDGEVLDNAQRDALRAAAIAAFGEENFDDRIRVLDKAPDIPGSDDRVNELAQIIKVMSPTSAATALVAGDRLTIDVAATDESEAFDIDEAIFNALSFESVDASVAVAASDGDNDKSLVDLAADFNSQESFATGSSDLTETGADVLAEIAELLAETSGPVQIRGHTSSDGDLLDNLRLSQARADSVAELLVAQGIDPGRIIALGFGQNEPIASNDSDEGRAQNNRIEFVIDS